MYIDGAFEGHLPASQSPVTTRLHHLPVVPLSRPCVITARALQSGIDSKEGYYDSTYLQPNKCDNVNREGAFTMSQSWPITGCTNKAGAKGKYCHCSCLEA